MKKKPDVKVIHCYLVGFPMNKLENGPMNHWRAGRRRIFPHEIIMPFCCIKFISLNVRGQKMLVGAYKTVTISI